jgi:hypothetical protein
VRTTRHITLIATAALLALAAPPAGAALSKKAYFDVRISATQTVSWTKDASAKDCAGGVTTITGKGSAWLKTSTATRPWLIAQRVPGATLATLQFAGRPGGAKAAGSYHREGDVQATSTSTSSSPNCGQSIPMAPDCGPVAVPRDAQLYLSYYSPAEWPYDGEPTPLVPSLVLTGPYSPEWTAPPFSFCQGINGDDWLGGTFSDGTDPIHTGPAPLPLSTLFGTRRRFKVTWSTRRTVDQLKIAPSNLSGTWPVTTSIHWTVRFTRRSGPPPLGAVDV